MSLEERRASLKKLKQRTKSKGCGEVGHWAGDPECKKKVYRVNVAIRESHEEASSSIASTPEITIYTADMRNTVPRLEDKQENDVPLKEQNNVSLLEDKQENGVPHF